MDWLRLWHDMPTDPKWRVIAKRSSQRVGDVIAVFNFMLVNASANANERGRTHNLFADDIAAALDLETDAVEAIFAAMIGKIWDEDGYLAGWQKRQPKREDSSAERAKRWRDERKRTQTNANERPDTDTDKSIPLAKANGAFAEIDEAQAHDPDTVFWANAKAYLGKSRGALIGKWKRDHGVQATAAAISAAQVERAVDPVSYIEGVFKSKRVQREPAIPI